MRRRISTFFLSLTLLASFSSAPLFAQVFDNEADWQAAICAPVIVGDFLSVVIDDDPLTTVADEQPNAFIVGPSLVTIDWGTIFHPGADSNFRNTDGNAALFFFNNTAPVLEFNAGLPQMQGFIFEYTSGSDAIVNIYTDDGAGGHSVAATLTIPVADEGVITTFAWVNVGGIDVSKIELDLEELVSGPSVMFLERMDFAFGDPCPPLDALNTLVDGLESLLPTGRRGDDRRIQCAINNLTAMQDPAFWSDDENLSENGADFFADAYNATRCLNKVKRTDVDQYIAGIQQILATLTANAIDNAINNGGDPDFIAAAQQFEAFAQLAESAGFYERATVFRQRAWLFAFNA